MEIDYIRGTWGMTEGTLAERLRRIRAGGFDGVEMAAPDAADEAAVFRKLLEDLGLLWVAQVFTRGATPAEHARSFEAQYRRAAGLGPVRVNAHTGVDHWPVADNLRIVDHALRLEAECGVPVSHEIHRGRMTFSAPATEALLKAQPDLRLTADFSHWCCVHESFLDDQWVRVELVARHSDHVHARVGHPEGPQVSDPRAPEWQEALRRHLEWWQLIVECARQRGEDRLTICPEFGPPDYMPTRPFTREPLADLWEVNVFMMDHLRAQLRL